MMKRVRALSSKEKLLVMRYFEDRKELFKEHLARLIATLILLSMGWCALHAWHWLVAWLR